MLGGFTLLTGFAYPLLITGVAQATLSSQANGSVVMAGGKPAGSELIGQPFSEPRYFWSRLSATAPVAFNGGASSGSNLGPMNPALVDAVEARITALREADPEATGPIPVDLVTASGSGLDPHISPAAALFQVRRVAKARGIDDATARALVERHTEARQFGIFGEPRVNVLRLNLALDGVRRVEPVGVRKRPLD
jgi:K+-transporting ATPase ATPase C chain